MAKSELEDFTKKRPPMFWWVLVNIFMIALAITSWLICLNVFRDPTHPVSYQWMMKVKRIDSLKNFTPTTAPAPKKTHDPLALESTFREIQKNNLQTLNQDFKREYLTNYKKYKSLHYVKGEFKIIETRPLTENDFLTQGTIIRAQAMVKPEGLGDPIPYPIFIEYLLPNTDYSAVVFKPEDSLTLKKIPDCAAILHAGEIAHDDSSALYFTLVSLCRTEFKTASGSAAALNPLQKANVGAPFPVFQ